MSEAITRLNKKRGVIKHKITSFLNYLNNVKVKLGDGEKVEENLKEISVRLEKFESVWEEYEKIQIDIDCLVTGEEIEEQYAVRSECYDNYIANIIFAKGLIEKYSTKTPSDRGANTSSGPIRSNAESASVESAIKLPIIELPKFNGNFNLWLEFKETLLNL